MPTDPAIERVATLRLRGLGGPLSARVSWPARPRAEAMALVLYGHPGRLDETTATADALCATAGIVVVAGSCWMTPIDAADAVLRRASAMLTWVADHAADLRADERLIAVGGVGRGGALAAAIALQARDRGWPPLARQLLIAPEFAAELLDAPLTAPSLAGVAPAIVAGDAAGYAERLRRAGVEVAQVDDAAPAELARLLHQSLPSTTPNHQGAPMTPTTADPSVVTQTYRTYVKASPEAVWEALTSGELAQQYGYGTPVEYDLCPGGAYRSLATDEMKSYGTPEVLIDGEVIEAEAPRRLVHTSRLLWDPEARAEGFTTVAFDLEARDGGITKLTVTHDVTGAPRTAAQFAGELPEGGGGWSEILSGLKTLLETGRPLAG